MPAPPFWGHRTLAPDWRFLDQLLPHLDRNTLFRHHWKYTIHDRAEWQRLVDEELEPRLRTLWAGARVQRWLTPRAIYGYYPVQADGNDLVVYDPAAYAASTGTPPGTPGALQERLRFTFPRQAPDGTKRNEDQLCLADYFRPLESGQVDVVAFQVVTAGEAASEYAERLRQDGQYNLELEVHGVAAQAAEAMAEYVHALVREQLRIAAPAGPALLLGLPRLPGPGGPGQAVPAAPGDGADRGGADRVDAVRPRAEHGGPGGAPPPGEVLLRPGGAADGAEPLAAG